LRIFHFVKALLIFPLLLLLVACTLNSEQERTLNASLTRYIDARNDGIVSVTVACTWPPAVAYYTAKGDSIFKKKYDLSAIDEKPILRDGSQMEAASDGPNYQIKYAFKQANPFYGVYEKGNTHIVALSENDGKTWFFLDEEDYWNDQIVSPSKRLLSK
jgi:hypothetical protein